MPVNFFASEEFEEFIPFFCTEHPMKKQEQNNNIINGLFIQNPLGFLKSLTIVQIFMFKAIVACKLSSKEWIILLKCVYFILAEIANDACINMECSGASTEYIQQTLGHSDVKTTESYLDSFGKEVKKICSPYKSNCG